MKNCGRIRQKKSLAPKLLFKTTGAQKNPLFIDVVVEGGAPKKTVFIDVFGVWPFFLGGREVQLQSALVHARQAWRLPPENMEKHVQMNGPGVRRTWCSMRRSLTIARRAVWFTRNLEAWELTGVMGTTPWTMAASDRWATCDGSSPPPPHPKKRKSINAKKMSRVRLFPLRLSQIQKIVPHQITNITFFLLIRKQETCNCNHFRSDGGMRPVLQDVHRQRESWNTTHLSVRPVTRTLSTRDTSVKAAHI